MCIFSVGFEGWLKVIKTLDSNMIALPDLLFRIPSAIQFVASLEGLSMNRLIGVLSGV